MFLRYQERGAIFVRRLLQRHNFHTYPFQCLRQEHEGRGATTGRWQRRPRPGDQHLPLL